MSHHVFVETLSYLASNKGVLIHFANLVLVSFKCSSCLFTHRSVLNVQNDFVTILCSSSITSALCCVHFHRALASGFRNGNRHWMVPGGRWIRTALLNGPRSPVDSEMATVIGWSLVVGGSNGFAGRSPTVFCGLLA